MGLLIDHDKISVNKKHLLFLATEIFELTSKLNPQFTWIFLSRIVIHHTI